MYHVGFAACISLGSTVTVTDSCMTTGVYTPKKVYVFGLTRYGSGNPNLSNWEYDPVADTWLTVNNMSTYRGQFGVAVVADILYVIGGKDAGEYDIFSINGQYIREITLAPYRLSLLQLLH